MRNDGILINGDLNVSRGTVSNTVVHSQRWTGVDVLVIAALKEEYDAARTVPGLRQWQDHQTDGPAPYATAELRTRTGGSLSIALARPTQMGGRSTSPVATVLTTQLRPRCLAMCGVCAGNPGTTTLGDVVVAAPAYQWDEGKHVSGAFRADHQQFPLDTRWMRAAQDFDPVGLPSYGSATDEEAAVWYLERLHKGQDPRTHPARGRYFPPASWSAGLSRLESAGLITRRSSRSVLTDAGRDRIERILYEDVDGPEKLPFKVFTGPMASGNAVMAEANIWRWLEANQRSLLALEMEAATIATVARERQVPHWLVAKGVMDHADTDKDDRFKAFAARASAEVLFALVGRLLEPAGTPAGSTPPAAAVPGSVQRGILRQLTYDWQDLADYVGVPSHDTHRFRAGDEPRELWTWLANRARLSDLPDALGEIGRSDLADLLRPYVN